MSMPLPFQLRISNRCVLLVGGGDAAEAKRRLLDERGAVVVNWTQPPSDEQMRQIEQCNECADTRIALVIIAEVNEWTTQLRAWIERERMLLNVVDAPEGSHGFIPAIVSRGAIQIGIGSGGVSPVIARMIRTRIEQTLPSGLEALADFAGRWQERVRASFRDVPTRRRFWERILSGSIGELVLRGDSGEADVQLAAALIAPQGNLGSVSLVGAGPGDAGYLTLTGLKRLQQADVVLYDRLVGREVLTLARRDAVMEDVGKRRGHCPVPQVAIIQRLLYWAGQGLTVCRLKGGDPYLFGRGGEEALALVAAGIQCEVVPGVTTASATSALLGMPLTHRGLARSVRFLTGHLALQQVETCWQSLAADQETLVLYMAFSHMQEIAHQLIQVGVSPSTPVAFVQNAASAQCVMHRGTLDEVSTLQSQFSLVDGPILIFVGQVVALSDQLLPVQSRQPDDNPLYWLHTAST